MRFQTTSSPAHVKYFGIAVFLIFVGLLYTLPKGRHRSTSAPTLASSGLLPLDDAFKSRYHMTWGSTASSKTPLAFMPLDEATLFCNQRRWEPYPDRSDSRKIYDLILINTELEWLEIRLGQMADQVDYFVILEAAKTFTDEPKPLHVRENWARFKTYHHKMILHTLNTEKAAFTDTWSRESFSRNAMYDQVIPHLTGVQEAFIGDVILVSDVDEIPSPDALKALRNCDFPKTTTLHTKIYYYGFQWARRHDWPHPQATFYAHADTTLPSDLRGSGGGGDLWNAGWHCSFCFSTVAELVKKITSFSHTEMNRKEFTVPKSIVERIRLGKDVFDREDCDRVEDNQDVPQFLKKNAAKYQFLLNRDGTNAGFVDYKVPVHEKYNPQVETQVGSSKVVTKNRL